MICGALIGRMKTRQISAQAASMPYTVEQPSRAMTRPLRAGPTTQDSSKVLLFHMTALLRAGRGTRLGKIALRAAQPKARPTPLMKSRR